MRAILLVALLGALAIAGCAAGPDEATQDEARTCPESSSPYHEAGTEGQATGGASDACPEGVDETSTKETAEQDATG